MSKVAGSKEQVFKSIVLAKHSRWLTYSFAVAMSIGMIAITETFWSIGKQGRGHTMLPLSAVFVSAVFGGIWPGLLSTLITTFCMLLFLAPSLSPSVESIADRVWLLIFFVFALGAAWLGAAFKSALRAGERASVKLEEEVVARTAELLQANDELRCLLLEIKQSQHFLDSLIENIPNVVFVKDARELKYVRINKATERLLGSLTQFIGKGDFDIFSKDIAEANVASDRQALATGMVVDRELIIPSRFAGERILHTRKLPIFNDDGKAVYILGISEDITERKRLEAQMLGLVYEQAARAEAERRESQLEDAVRARDTFLSVCSHELKTPLTSLKLQAGIIRMLLNKRDSDSLLSPRVSHLVHETDKEIDRITRLVNDMLDVSRIRSGKLTLRPQKSDLSRIVNEVVERFLMDPYFKNPKIRVCTPAEVPGTWDRDRIEQVVVNLVSNALKYGMGKPISVSIACQPEKIQLIVEDEGIGIAPEDQARIFRRFERAGAAEGISGLGLGLFIVKEIVNTHGGTIRVESEIGKGSRFIVELPSTATQVLSKAA